jgi:PAS domain S-box-containing protein
MADDLKESGTRDDLVPSRPRSQDVAIDYRIIFDANSNAMAFTEAESGRIVDVNAAWLAATGYAREDAIGRRALDLGLWPDPVQRAACYAQLQENGILTDFAADLVFRAVEIPHLMSARPVEMGGNRYVLWEFRNIAAQRQAEETLRRASVYNRSLIEVSLDPLVTIGPDGKITDVNKATEEATGLSRERLVGTDFSDYFAEPEKARAGYRQVFREGQVRDYALDLRHRDGRVTSVLYNASLYRDEAGEVIGVFAAARDITERKWAESALRESEAKVAAAFHASPDLMAITRLADGTILEVNEGYSRMLGYSREESLGKTTAELAIWADQEDRNTFAAALASSGRIMNFETRLRRKNGSVITVIDSARTITIKDDICVLSVAHDITERKRAEDSLRESEERYRLHFENVSDVLFSLDEQGRFLSVSPSIERILGYRPDELLGKSFVELGLVAPEYLEQGIADVGRVFSGETIAGGVYEFVAKDGTRRVGELSFAQLFRDGTVVAIASVARDITERKRAEEALRESEDKFRYVFDHSPIGKSITFLSGELNVNQAFCDMLGYSPEELRGRRWQDITHPDDIGLSQSELDTIVSGQRDSSRFVKRYLHKNGAVVWGDVTTSVRRDRDGKPLYFMTAVSDITARKRAAEDLEASQAFLERVIQLSPFAMWVADDKGTVLRTNRSLRETLNLTDQQIVGRYNVLEDENLVEQGVMPQVRAVFERLEPARFSIPWTGKKAGKVDFEGARDLAIDVSMFPIVGSDAKLANVVCQWVDITERRRAEESLRKSEGQLSNALEMASLGHWEYDVAGDVFTFNDHFYAIFRTTVEQVGGYTMSSAEYARRFVHPDDAFLVAEEVRRAIEATDPRFSRQLEHRMLYADGTVGHIAVRFFIVKDDQGRTVKTYGVNQDITDRKRAEEALRESELKYSTLVGHATDGVIVVQDEVVKFCNTACADATGYSLEELSGMPFQRIVAPESRSLVLERYQARMTGKEVPANYEIVVVRKDGAKRVVELSVARIQYEGRPATMSIARDITERKQAEEQLQAAKAAAEAASRAKSEFLAVMSHEIRTPIAAIGGYADLLISSDLPAGERRQGLETIRSNVDNLSRLVDDILDLSRIEAGRLPLVPADCSPHEIVEDVRNALRFPAAKKQLDLQIVYDGPVPRTIRTDVARLRQILLNLVGNAVKFTEAGSVRVTVRCPRSEGSPARLEFEVADTGVGMTMEALGRLFQPFTQADMSTTRRFGGAGLGLSISQRLARMPGGEIEVRSELGKGSTFTLAIEPGPLEGVPMLEGVHSPISADFAAEIGTVPRPTPQRPKLTGRVLLAEDSEDVERLIRRFLGQCGLEVDVAPDGRVACEKAAASGREGRPYDLILMDIRMPKMDGHEATRQLRQDGWRGAIVALTAHAMPGDREECLRAGCDDYLTKPSRLSDLIDVVQRYVKRSTPEPEQVRTPEGFPLDIDADPELAELFRAFTEDLPRRAELIRTALETSDFVDVRHHAHQLKGAAAMYGFPVISRLAARILQKAAEQAPADELRATVAELTALCQQAAARRRADGG